MEGQRNIIDINNKCELGGGGVEKYHRYILTTDIGGGGERNITGISTTDIKGEWGWG